MDTTPCSDDWIQHPKVLQAFRTALITWGLNNFRVFPWRLVNDPYSILLAEIMLHRTQVVQVVPIFQEFIYRFPTMSELAQANQKEIQSSLSSLGLHWRINLIHGMAQQIAKQFEMQVPREKAHLLSLPGVSEYIASAVRCFAWNLPEPLIDTNTVRVTGRMFGLEIKDSSRRNPRYRGLITALLDPQRPREYNYALLDLAHLICLKKQEPVCEACPLFTFCCYGQNKISTTIINSDGRDKGEKE